MERLRYNHSCLEEWLDYMDYVPLQGSFCLAPASPIDRSFRCELSKRVREMIFPCRLCMSANFQLGKTSPKPSWKVYLGLSAPEGLSQWQLSSGNGLRLLQITSNWPAIKVKAVAVEFYQVVAIASYRHSGPEKRSRYNHGLLENGLPDCINGVWRHAVWLPKENYVNSILRVILGIVVSHQHPSRRWRKMLEMD